VHANGVLKILTTAPEIAAPEALETFPEMLTFWANPELRTTADTKTLKTAFLIDPPYWLPSRSV
jgi:hypothetical protein